MTAIAAEVDRFNRLAATWWDSSGPMRPLHVINRLRLAYLLQLIEAQCAALAAVAAQTAAAQAVKLEESDPTAVALGYKHDAATVDAARYPTFAAGRICANCQLYQAKAGEASGACGAFGGKSVNANGWCIAWVKKA